MTTTDELIKRLMEEANDIEGYSGEVMRHAADVIRAQAQEIERLNAEIDNIKCIEFPARIDKVCADWRNRAERAEAERDEFQRLLGRATSERDEAIAARESIEQFSHAKSDEIARLNTVIEAAKAMRKASRCNDPECYMCVDAQAFDAALAQLEQEKP